MVKQMKKWLLRNWTVKIAALALAIAIRYLINLHLEGDQNQNPFTEVVKEQLQP